MVKKAKKLRGGADPFDQIWCVFDVESGADQAARHGLAEAMDNAHRNQIEVAVSSPCFELFLLLHREEAHAPMSRQIAQKKCADLRLTSEKNICDASALLDLYPAARARAIELDARHAAEEKKRPEDKNPSSGLYKLIDAIYAAFPTAT